MRGFGIAIRADVLALVKADQRAAAQLADAATGLRSLTFDDDQGTSDRAVIQAVDFHGGPLPEKPPYLPPVPPPEGWSEDPLMRAAQKIAYGHAWDKHGHEFPGIMNQAQFAEFIHQKMQRAITDPSGLVIGRSVSDGVPLIYDPQENVLIIRDTRPNATDAGTAFRPDLKKDPNFVTDKFGSYQSTFTADDLADRAPQPPPSPSSPESSMGSVGPPSDLIAAPESGAGGGGGGGSWGDEKPATGAFPNLGSIKDRGTYVPPEELATQDGALGILGRILLGQRQPDATDPDSWA